MNELKEEDFIQEGWRRNPGPLVFFLGVLVVVAFLGYCGTWWVSKQLEADNPFSQVTNRQMSLFLWQFPEFMRAHQEKKSGYMPGFDYHERVGIKEGHADKWVLAPPEVLFRYHHWSLFLGSDVVEREVGDDFDEFLADQPEWRPENWQPYDRHGLPIEVRQAYLGWKNYFKEGDGINQGVYTYGDVRTFVGHHPGYARNIWRNILGEDYLVGLEEAEEEEIVPTERISGALRAALWNSRQT